MKSEAVHFCGMAEVKLGANALTENVQLPLSYLREIGWQLWDPIGLLPGNADWREQSFIDEYDAYLLHAAFRLSGGWSVEQAVAYLIEVEAETMGLGLRLTSRKRAEATIQAILVGLAGNVPCSD
jgi:hypothetical protein